MTDTATVTITLDLWQILSGLFGSGSLGAVLALAGYRLVNGKATASCPLNGRLSSLDKLNTTLEAFIQQQREFSSHVAHEHKEQLGVIHTCAVSLAEQSRVLAVVVDRMARRE